MKITKILNNFAFGVLGFTALTMNGKNIEGERELKPYITDSFSITTWNMMGDNPYMGYITKELVQGIPEAGYDTIGFPDISLMDSVLKSGAKVIVADCAIADLDWKVDSPEKIRKVIDEAVVRFQQWKDIIVGFKFADEPGADAYKGLAVAIDHLRSIDPKLWGYVNLFPNYGTPAIYNAPTYDEYVDRFITECKPSVLSFDHYPIIKGRIRVGFWDNMVYFYSKADAVGVPVIPVMLTSSHLSYGPPVKPHVRFQAFAHMAFGAKGLQHFTYFSPRIGNYELSPIDGYGRKTETWNTVQLVNSEVAELAKVLHTAKHIKTYYAGPEDLRPEQLPPAGPNDNIQETPTAPMLVGDFIGADGRKASLLVNIDLKTEHPLTLRYNKTIKVAMMKLPYPVPPHPFRGEFTTVAAGGCVLLQFD
jgi:hypothetical protein